MRTHDTIKYVISLLLLVLIISRIFQFIFQTGETIIYQIVLIDPEETYNIIEGIVIVALLFLLTIPILLLVIIIYITLSLMNALNKESKLITNITIFFCVISVILNVRAIIITIDYGMSIFYIVHLIGYIIVIALLVLSRRI